MKWMSEVRRKQLLQRVLDWAEDNEVTVTLLGQESDRHDFAPAIVGVALEPRPAVIYSAEAVIQCFMHINKWSDEEAREWFEYNTVRGLQYAKPEDNPPILITEMDDVI